MSKRMECPGCGHLMAEIMIERAAMDFHCPSCGRFTISQFVEEVLPPLHRAPTNEEAKRMLMSIIRRLQMQHQKELEPYVREYTKLVSMDTSPAFIISHDDLVKMNEAHVQMARFPREISDREWAAKDPILREGSTVRVPGVGEL